MNEETSLGVVRFAHQHEMPLLMSIAADKLKMYTSLDNCVERLYLADSLHIPSPRAESLKIIRSDLMAISKTREFKDIPFTILDEILDSKDIRVPSQTELFYAIIRWTFHTLTPSTETQLSASPWKLAEANRLLRHTNVTKMGFKEVRALANHPAILSPM